MSLDILQICGTIRELEVTKPARPGGLRKIFENLGEEAVSTQPDKSGPIHTILVYACSHKALPPK
jgi:hypothetical protein